MGINDNDRNQWWQYQVMSMAGNNDNIAVNDDDVNQWWRLEPTIKMGTNDDDVNQQ